MVETCLEDASEGDKIYMRWDLAWPLPKGLLPIWSWANNCRVDYIWDNSAHLSFRGVTRLLSWLSYREGSHLEMPTYHLFIFWKGRTVCAPRLCTVLSELPPTGTSLFPMAQDSYKASLKRGWIIDVKNSREVGRGTPLWLYMGGTKEGDLQVSTWAKSEMKLCPPSTEVLSSCLQTPSHCDA